MEPNRIILELAFMESTLDASSKGLFHKNAPGREYIHEKGIYRHLPLLPNKTLQSALNIDREILVILSNFEELQPRIMTVTKTLLRQNQDRFDKTFIMIIHNDRRGNSKLKNWGRENGIAIMPVYFNELKENKDLALIINNELYNQDPYDITGPVSNESEFFGRRDEAMTFARKIQKGSVHSILGVRKTGKTSLINRITLECNDKYDCQVVFIDCSKDEIWALNSELLISSLYKSIQLSRSAAIQYSSLSIAGADEPGTIDDLVAEISRAEKPVIIIFDEFDYLTLSSPTNKETWERDFNILWRQIRVGYQEIKRRTDNLSLVLCGVSSKWFRVSTIAGIENAAVSFIPEEYLVPFQENAVLAMIKTLGNRCGIQYEPAALDLLYRGTSGIPSWTRKACSYLNRKMPVENRPATITENQASQLFDEFVIGEGISYSKVAIEHLFSVYPETKTILERFKKDPNAIRSDEKHLLQSYGIINSRGDFSGGLMKSAVLFCLENSVTEAPEIVPGAKVANLEWADEIAELAKRQNVLERSLRSILLETIKAESRVKAGSPTSKDRILKAMPEKRRLELGKYSSEQIVEKSFWLELVAIFQREYGSFQAVFGDQGTFVKNMEFLNDRPYAHAKKIEAIELVAYKNSLKYLEDKIYKYENV